MRGLDLKGAVLRTLYGRWRSAPSLSAGYTVLLPVPADMPFLLRFALEGLARLDTTHCRQIVVVSDGSAEASALAAIVREAHDPRLELVAPRGLDRLVVEKLLRGNGSALHWMTIVLGTTAARCEHVFLHDADAFFAEADGLERQYRACLEGGLDTLGVTARWDPKFREIGYELPGTWEMFYATRWARRHKPADLKGRLTNTPHGPVLFDTMLYPQYLDHARGRIGVMADPPRFVHFHGTIVTYRTFKERKSGPIVDELFRILLLAVLEDLLPSADGPRQLPSVADLARGLTDPEARVRYDTPAAAREFIGFRAQLLALCEAPIFQGPRGERIRALIAPFEEHFANRPPPEQAPAGLRMRTHGLG